MKGHTSRMVHKRYTRNRQTAFLTDGKGDVHWNLLVLRAAAWEVTGPDMLLGEDWDGWGVGEGDRVDKDDVFRSFVGPESGLRNPSTYTCRI